MTLSEPTTERRITKSLFGQQARRMIECLYDNAQPGVFSHIQVLGHVCQSAFFIFFFSSYPLPAFSSYISSGPTP